MPGSFSLAAVCTVGVQKSVLRGNKHERSKVTPTIRTWIVRSEISAMDSIIYLVGLVVIIMLILSLLGLR